MILPLPTSSVSLLHTKNTDYLCITRNAHEFHTSPFAWNPLTIPPTSHIFSLLPSLQESSHSLIGAGPTIVSVYPIIYKTVSMKTYSSLCPALSHISMTQSLCSIFTEKVLHYSYPLGNREMMNSECSKVKKSWKVFYEV